MSSLFELCRPKKKGDLIEDNESSEQHKQEQKEEKNKQVKSDQTSQSINNQDFKNNLTTQEPSPEQNNEINNDKTQNPQIIEQNTEFQNPPIKKVQINQKIKVISKNIIPNSEMVNQNVEHQNNLISNQYNTQQQQEKNLTIFQNQSVQQFQNQQQCANSHNEAQTLRKNPNSQNLNIFQGFQNNDNNFQDNQRLQNHNFPSRNQTDNLDRYEIYNNPCDNNFQQNQKCKYNSKSNPNNQISPQRNQQNQINCYNNQYNQVHQYHNQQNQFQQKYGNQQNQFYQFDNKQNLYGRQQNPFNQQGNHQYNNNQYFYQKNDMNNNQQPYQQDVYLNVSQSQISPKKDAGNYNQIFQSQQSKKIHLLENQINEVQNKQQIAFHQNFNSITQNSPKYEELSEVNTCQTFCQYCKIEISSIYIQLSCFHYYCQECLKEHLKEQFNQSKTTFFRCQCGKKIKPQQIWDKQSNSRIGNKVNLSQKNDAVLIKNQLWHNQLEEIQNQLKGLENYQKCSQCNFFVLRNSNYPQEFFCQGCGKNTN